MSPKMSVTKRCRDCDARLALHERRRYVCGGKPTKVFPGRRGRHSREDDRAILTLLWLALIFVVAPLYIEDQTQAVIARIVVTVIAASLLATIVALSQDK